MLPRNFDLIPINKLQIDKLRAEDIEYCSIAGMRKDADSSEYE